MQRQQRDFGKVVAIVGLLVATAGCHMLTNSWLDPSQVGSFDREVSTEIRTSLSIQDTPYGIPGATDPQPVDLQPSYESYRYEIGDVVVVRIFELLARNTETAAQGTIDEVGTITIPVLGQIRVAGMTRSEITEELRTLVKERGYVKDPTVIVEPGLRRGLSYLLYGAVSAPNLYPISKPDTRLLEVLNTAGGLFDTVTDVYVIRDATPPSDVVARGPASQRGVLASASNGPVFMSDGLGRGGDFAIPHRSDDQPSGSAGTKPTQDEEADLMNAVEPPSSQPATPEPMTESAPQDVAADNGNANEVGELEEKAAPEDLNGTAPGGEPGAAPRWVFVNGEWVESSSADTPQTADTSAPVVANRPELPANVAPQTSDGADLDWTKLVADVEKRVIRVSAQGLRDGDYRQNIVVRGGDTIRVMAGEFGEYYMMGQIVRPGAYSLTGRKITLKTAIASAGNLAPLAWPDRCTIYRRYGDREEMHQVSLPAIFAGKEPDVMLKPNDLILVGTHPVAPFLAVARNAFRLTYGFGFVYDRNFADRDNYGPRINPANLPSGVGSNFPNIFR